MSTTVFPQTGDPDAGELFALLLGQENTTDFVGRGLSVNVDTSANTASVGDGNCYIHIDSATVPNTSRTVEDLGYAVQIDSQTVDLPHSGTNHIAVVPDYTELDTVTIEAFDVTNNIPGGALYIAAVDPDTGDVTLQNREPDVTAEDLTVVGGATINADLSVSGTVTVDSDIVTDDGTTIVSADNEVPLSALAADTVTINTTGDLTGGGSVTLGDSVTLGTDVPVTSVFGRTGTVTANSGDYTHAQLASVSNDDHHAWPVPNSGLSNDAITINATGDLSGGGTVSLGGSISLDVDTPQQYGDADAIAAVDGEVSAAANTVSGLDTAVTGKTDLGHDHTGTNASQIPDSALVEDYVTSAESSTYTDSDAISAVDGEVSLAAVSVSGLDSQVNTNVSDISSLQSNKLDSSAYTPESDTHSRYTDSEAIGAVDDEVSVAAVSVSGLDSQVSTNVSDISSLQSNKLDSSAYTPETDTHDRYADSEAISAVDGEVSAAASTVSGLDSQVSTNASDISSLQSDKLDASAYVLGDVASASPGDTAPTDTSVAVDPNTGTLLVSK